MVEAFGAIRAADEQSRDTSVTSDGTVKPRAVLVDRKVRRDRRYELNQLHVLLCVVARRHVAAAGMSGRALAERRGDISACGELGGRRRAQSVRRVALSTRSSSRR